jgi:hypothetical protein
LDDGQLTPKLTLRRDVLLRDFQRQITALFSER